MKKNRWIIDYEQMEWVCMNLSNSLCFIYDSPSGGSIWTYSAVLMHYKKVAAETEYYVIYFQ